MITDIVLAEKEMVAYHPKMVGFLSNLEIYNNVACNARFITRTTLVKRNQSVTC